MSEPHVGDNVYTYGSNSIGKLVNNVDTPRSSGLEMLGHRQSGVAWKDLVFISYRSTEERAAVYIEAELTRRLGPQAAFRDANMSAGIEFPDELLAKARSCRLMLAIIGEKWDHEDHGLRLLRDPADWVRMEIGTALAYDVTVVPIMVGARGRLIPGDLPPDIRPIAYLQGKHLRHGYDLHDVRRLVAELL